MEGANNNQGNKPGRIRYVPVVGPRLQKLLFLVFALFTLLAVNSFYLASITFLEWVSGNTYQGYFYQYNFLLHLVAGLLIVMPVCLFGAFHIRNAWPRPNRRAVYAGLALFSTALVLLATGITLTRFDFFEVKDPLLRNLSYWLHVISPLVVAWLFVLHRLAGRRIRWRTGARWAAFAGAFALMMVVVHAQNPLQWNVTGPASGEQYFFPSLSRTASGNFIPAQTMMMDKYCAQCHADAHEGWQHSVHRFSSFNNPAYLFSVRETREALTKRDGNLQSSRFCAGCHDPVPFFSGAFDDPKFDDVHHPTSQAGITCTACHAITNINSVRGNADYTISEPLHYPFAYSDNALLQWVNRQLVKAKPEFHKKTFLKPFHRTAEFCATCHKVHLPPEVNKYKWLRGQNHYDAYLLSGVSGHGVTSFYYPPKAVHTCAVCHMKLAESEDFGARDFDASGKRKIHDHLFAAANSAIPYLLGMPPEINQAREKFLDGVMRVDIFGVKEGGAIDGQLSGPLRPRVPTLKPGQRYLLETVIRTVKMGHLFTQGTADSNEVWMDVTVSSNGRTIGRSGGMKDDGEVDPWSHFVNAYVLDRDGNRIDRRNAQDIFVALYNHQIPPGAGDVVHYVMDIPRDVRGPVTVEVKLQYRKFDTIYMKHFQGERFFANNLPVLTLATDRVTFPVAGTQADPGNPDSKIETWQRWNDYGIGLLRKGNKGSSKGELRQAAQAFTMVEQLGRADGPLNLARVYLKEGRLEDASAALRRAAQADPPAPPWSVTWFTGLVNKQSGFLDAATADFKQLAQTNFAEARKREFDFSQDYRLLNELGQTVFERAKQERGEARVAARETLLHEAVSWFDRALAVDPENATAHYNLGLIYAQLGDEKSAQTHRDLHAKYKPDDNARERAVTLHRRQNAAANHAAEAVVLYDLRRPGAYGLADADTGSSRKTAQVKR